MSESVYKNIPNNWEECFLDKVCDVRDGTHDSPEYVEQGIPFITSKNIIGGRVNFEDITFISKDNAIKINKRSKVDKHDIIMSMIGSIGEIAYIDIEPDFCIKNVALIKPVKINPIYLSYFLQSSIFNKHLLDNLDGGIQKFISLGKLRKLKIAIPNTKEQQAIAEALSDADALLASLDALIEKKRNIKQGLMQQLLTGRTRLPGFSGDWEEKTLGQIGDITGAGVDKKIHPNEQPVRLLNYLDVYHKDFIYSYHLNHWVSANNNQIRKCSIEEGDVFFTPTSETPDDIGHSAVAMESIPDAAYSYHLVRLRIKEKWDLRFKAFAFKTNHFMNQAFKQAEGSGTRYVISLKRFRDMKVKYPPYEEQIAIGGVLFDADQEIEALQQRREKTALLKQGMMQELLTGRKRLV